jgi:hypothetical protein
MCVQRLKGLAQEILKFWSALDQLAHEPALRDDFRRRRDEVGS